MWSFPVFSVLMPVFHVCTVKMVTGCAVLPFPVRLSLKQGYFMDGCRRNGSREGGYMSKTDKICSEYVGRACVDGSCPVANADEYAEYGMDVIRRCEDCWMRKGCEDCILYGTEHCPDSLEEVENCDTVHI